MISVSKRLASFCTLCSWESYLTLTVPLFNQVYNIVTAKVLRQPDENVGEGRGEDAVTRGGLHIQEE